MAEVDRIDGPQGKTPVSGGTPVAVGDEPSPEGQVGEPDGESRYSLDANGWWDSQGNPVSSLVYLHRKIGQGWSLGPALAFSTDFKKDAAASAGLSVACDPGDSHELYLRGLAGASDFADSALSWTLIAGDYLSPFGEDNLFFNLELQASFGDTTSLAGGASMYAPFGPLALFIGPYVNYDMDAREASTGLAAGVNLPIEF